MEFKEKMLWKENGKTQWFYGNKFIEFLKYKLKTPIPITNLSKEIGIGYPALMRIIKENNLLILDTKFSNNFKAIYQDYEWCYQKFMIEGLNHDEMAKEANCSKRVIEKWCQEKHKLNQEYRQKNKQVNQIQNDLLIGSMLGDGHIDKRENQAIFIVVHAEDQKDYLYWKYEILKDFCNIRPTERQAMLKNFNGKDYPCQKSYRICTRVQDCFKKYRSMSYSELITQLNEFSIAVWVLDDGCRHESNWDLCVAEYSQEEIELAINIFKIRFNLNARQQKDKRYLMFDAESSRKLDSIILKIIPNELDIIKNKITENNKIRNEQKRINIIIDNQEVLLSEYCKDNNLNYRRIINRTYKGVDIYDSLRKEGEVI